MELEPTARSGAHLDAGAGADLLDIGGDDVSVDLSSGTAQIDGRRRLEAVIAGFDHVTVEAETSLVVGDGAANRIEVFACRSTARGGGGNDRYAVVYVHESFSCFGGDHRFLGGPGDDRAAAGAGSDHLLGGPGHDDLRGAQRNDRLVGGPGRDRLIGDDGKRDRAYGGPGRDRCRAELRSGCEER